MQQVTEKKFVFTESKIAKLPFADKGKRYEVYDAQTPNLALRVGATRKIYYLIKRAYGQTRYCRLGDAGNLKLQKAREQVIATVPCILKGQNPNDEKQRIRKDITLKDFYNEYYKPRHSELTTKPLTQKTNDNLFRIQLAPFHNKRMMNITGADVAGWHSATGTKSKYRANRALALIRHMYNKAIVWGLSVSDNPTRGIGMFPEQSRRRFLRPDEIPRFYHALEQTPNRVFRNYILLSLYCGQRRSNMLALRWQDVDFTQRVIYIADTKSNEPQTVPLVDQAYDLLVEMKKNAVNELIFPSNRKQGHHLTDARGAWNDLLKRANIQDFRLHDLRRTFGSYMAKRNTNETIIQRALGDRSRAAASVYMRVGLDPVRENIQGAIDEITQLATPKQKKDE